MALVITGAKAIIKMEGVPLAFASGVDIDHENRLEEIPQLDDLVVAEYAENGHRCTINVSFFKTNTNSARALGFDPDNIKDLILQNEVTIQVVDERNQPIYTAYGCRFGGGKGTLAARGIWEGSWTFKARRGIGI